MNLRKIVVSVIGGHDSDEEVEDIAYNIGKYIAEMECILVCGGLGGVMEASAKGAKSVGGVTIGLLPGSDKNDANPFIDIPLPTTIGYARNVMVVCAGDIVVALPGSHGTRSEISYALVHRRPVIDLGNWNIEGMIKAENFEDAKSILQKHAEELKASLSDG